MWPWTRHGDPRWLFRHDPRNEGGHTITHAHTTNESRRGRWARTLIETRRGSHARGTVDAWMEAAPGGRWCSVVSGLWGGWVQCATVVVPPRPGDFFFQKYTIVSKFGKTRVQPPYLMALGTNRRRLGDRYCSTSVCNRQKIVTFV